MPPSGTEKTQLRKQLRAQRRALPCAQQQRAAQGFFDCIKRQPATHKAKRIAFYFANDGELNLAPFLHWCFKNKKTCYLPVLRSQRSRELLFLPFNKNTAFKKNRFGIPEPFIPRHLAIPPWQLDIILLPLVGFDRYGGRLGMGGGFYDKSLQGIQTKPRKPLLIGVGHQCQRVESIPREAWDIPLDAVISDRGIEFLSTTVRHRFHAV